MRSASTCSAPCSWRASASAWSAANLARRCGEMEGDRAVLHHRGDRLHAGQRLEAGLRLARLGGLVAEAVDEGLDVAPLGLLLGMLGGLVIQVLAAQALEAVVVAGIGRQLAVPHVNDAVHRAVEEAAEIGRASCRERGCEYV